MKDWLEKQGSIEKDVLDAIAGQTRGIADDLLPQIRLAALENEMTAVVELKINLVFEDDETNIWSYGEVQFPAKHSASATITL
jgi:hypothetical protein